MIKLLQRQYFCDLFLKIKSYISMQPWVSRKGEKKKRKKKKLQ